MAAAWRRRKPLHAVFDREETLRRHLTFLDLLIIGVTGTLGSGIFVLMGQIAHRDAGPATFLSFALAGIAAACSGVSFAELSSRIAASGSTYAFCYVCIGQVAAVVAGACLTLEYAIAGAAVARGWGDKVVEWLSTMGWQVTWMNTGWNLPASLVSMASTAVLLAGVKESKAVTAIITAVKLLLVAGMVLGGFWLWQPANMTPLAPFGVHGIFRGATSSFFAFLGFDECCCLGGEAVNPARDMSRAVVGTLLIVTLAYVAAALALTGMLDYTDISPTSGFPSAFAQRGIQWAADVTALGEIATLPVVVLVSLLAQPRLLLGMAEDGLLPAVFARVDGDGNLWAATLISGTVMTLIATFIPFTYLDDLISVGILVAFTMTNSCLVLLRCESPSTSLLSTETHLAIYNMLCFVTAILWSHRFLPTQEFVAGFMTLLCLASLLLLARDCPRSPRFGGSILNPQPDSDDSGTPFFVTPWVPYLPCIGMAINWFLIAQLEVSGILLLLLYLGFVVGLWLMFAPTEHSWEPNYSAVRVGEGEDNIAMVAVDRGKGVPAGVHLRRHSGNHSIT